MADRKISDLTALTAPAAGDYLPIVDISEALAANKNKRITIEELLRGAPNGTAAAPGIAFESDDNTGLYSPGADQLAISTGGTGRLFVDASGIVTIGNSSSLGNSILGIRGSIGDVNFRDSGCEVHFTRNSNSDIFANGGSSANLQIGANSHLSFQTGTTLTERARIDSSGRLLVGTSTATAGYNLSVYKASGANGILAESASLGNGESVNISATGPGNRYATIGVYKHSAIANSCPYQLLSTENALNYFYWTDNSGNFRISSDAAHIGTTSGTVVGTQTSDERLKNIIGPVEYGLETLKQIEPVRYALKSEPDAEKLGFIAQQVQPLIPQSVFDTNEHIESEPEDAPTKLGMEYVSLIPVLVNAIKELSAEVDALKAQLA